MNDNPSKPLSPEIATEATNLRSETVFAIAGIGDYRHIVGEELFRLRQPESKSEYDAVMASLKKSDSAAEKMLEAATITEKNGQHCIECWRRCETA